MGWNVRFVMQIGCTLKGQLQARSKLKSLDQHFRVKLKQSSMHWPTITWVMWKELQEKQPNVKLKKDVSNIQVHWRVNACRTGNSPTNYLISYVLNVCLCFTHHHKNNNYFHYNRNESWSLPNEQFCRRAGHRGYRSSSSGAQTNR